MKFKDLEYQRPDLDAQLKESKELLKTMENASSEEEYFDAIKKGVDIGNEIMEMGTIANIRNSIDTTIDFYETEKEAYDAFNPRYQEVLAGLAKIRLESKYRYAYEEKYGDMITKRDELQKEIFDPSIIEDRVKESQLENEYTKLTATAKIEFDGEFKNLSQMSAYYESTDREVRKEAFEKVNAWFLKNQDELDRIYDELVALRTEIAKKLGFATYDQVAYKSMGRIGWDKTDAKKYRDQIVEHIVPLVTKLYEEQRKRIGVDTLKYYDAPLAFLTGNPMPVGEEDVLVNAAQNMYRELSPQTGEFFDTMVEREMMDLTTKEGKAPGGYMTSLPITKLPFIFSNFNGTSADVDVLTHEAGHAYQGYVTRDVYPPENAFPSMELAETHSMSMEYFTHPWMEDFFGEDTEKYYYNHVVASLKFLPYGASIDEFQEWVYENPTATPEERRHKYRELEKKYLPHIDYDGNEYLENGGRWQRQLHVYRFPMYYLDYTIAQINAFQYFIWDRENHEEAWASYNKLCELGGRYPFDEMLEKVGLNNPFKEGTIAPIVEKLEEYLASLDQSKIK